MPVNWQKDIRFDDVKLLAFVDFLCNKSSITSSGLYDT
jgi:hypothetical protein